MFERKVFAALSKHTVVLLTSIIAAFALVEVPGALGGGITPTSIRDQFGGDQLDSAIWVPFADDPNVTVSQGQGRVTVAVPSNAAQGFNAGIATRCKAHGDFDARLRFSLVDWPSGDGLLVSLLAVDLGGVNTYRTNNFGSEQYGSFIPPSGGTLVPANGNRGVLRLTRQGETITSSYRQGGHWVTIFSGIGPTSDTVLNLTVFNLSAIHPFGGLPATITFRSFALDADGVVC
jgi:hypothetical protein